MKKKEYIVDVKYDYSILCYNKLYETFSDPTQKEDNEGWAERESGMVYLSTVSPSLTPISMFIFYYKIFLLLVLLSELCLSKYIYAHQGRKVLIND